MSVRSTMRALTAVAAITAAGAASAQTFYTDRAAFTAATGALPTQTFDSFTADTSFQTTPVVVGDVTFAGSGISQGSRNIIEVAPFNVGSVNGSPDVTIQVSANGNSLATLTFASPINSFGADFWDLNNAQPRTAIQINGQLYNPPVAPAGTVNFFGFVSDTSFTQLTFLAPNAGSPDGFSLDNMTYGIAAAGAPEPATWAMMIGGFGLVGAALRRRRRGGESALRTA